MRQKEKKKLEIQADRKRDSGGENNVWVHSMYLQILYDLRKEHVTCKMYDSDENARESGKDASDTNSIDYFKAL